MSATKTRPKAGPYAVNCYSCRKLVHLTQEEYDAAIDDANAPWKCPLCGGRAEWNDANFEDWQSYGSEG